MRVLQISKFYPPDHGGIEAVARDLSAGLRRNDVEVDVLCASKGRGHADQRDASGVRITRAGSWGIWLSTSMAPGLVRELTARRADYDVVHVHMPDPLAALAVWTARPRAAIVLHWHSDVVRQRFARHVYNPLERWLVDRADAVIATSAAYAESSPRLRQARGKVHVIPIGAPAPRSPDMRRVERLRAQYAGRRIVFALGRMTYYKGWEVLIEVARALPDDTLIVIGGGGKPGLATYRAMADAAGLSDRVLFTGPLSADSLEDWFKLAEIFCMPSTVRAEAYGIAALEAMARGVPVVASDIPGSGLGWLVQHERTGLKVPVRDVDAFATALRRLLDDAPLRRRLGEAGRERWAAQFTAEKMADKTIALYRQLLAQDTAQLRAPVSPP